MAKAKFPETKTVFIGPCISKRKEGKRNDQVDFVMSFEELNALIVALEINLGSLSDNENRHNKKTYDRGFALVGGLLQP
jgi:iron only hydrogenase large subunit-like protein